MGKIYLFIPVLIVFVFFIIKNTNNWRYQKSAERGIDWVINNEDKIDPIQAVGYLKNIYNVIDNKELKEKIELAIIKSRSRIDDKPMKVQLAQDVKIDWYRDVAPAVDEIKRKKCFGDNVFGETEFLKKILTENKDIFFSGSMTNLSRYIAQYFLNDLGIETSNLFSNPKCDKYDPNSRDDVYCVTHKVIFKSRYYQNYVDSIDFNDEIVFLNKTLSTNINEMKNDSVLDYTAESLVALKLLKQQNDSMVSTKNMIMKLQNNDGSWGHYKIVDSQKVHGTVLSVLALLKFSQTFVQEDIFCR